jgi:hypothetical protein
MGLGQLSLWLIAYFRGTPIPEGVIGGIKIQHEGEALPLLRSTNFWIAVGIFLLGCALPLSEKIIPERYPQKLNQERRAAILQTSDPALNDFVKSGGIVIHGKALYPRFHKAGQGEDGDSIRTFMPMDFPKVSFYMVGPYNTGVLLPQQTTPTDFPNGADVLVIGCKPEEKNKTTDALFVVIYDDTGEIGTILKREPFPETLACPLPAP